MKRSRRAWISALLAWTAVIGLAGCTWTDTTSLPDEYSIHDVYGAHTIGQEFTCHHAGLKAIDILLRATASESTVTLRIKENLDDAQDITSVTILVTPREQPAFEHFDLTLQDDVNGKSFFLLIESPTLNEAQAVEVPYQTESDHILVLDGAPISGHTSFQLHYSNWSIVRDLGRQVLVYGGKTLWLLLLSALLYLLPGGAAVVWLLREGDRIERAILATGLSVAILALLMYATMTGLRLNSAIVASFLVSCGGAIAARWWLDWRKGTFRIPSLRYTVDSLRQDPAPAALAIVFALVLGVRLFVVRDLVAPMWGDSYQHTMISQLMIENGGLFNSWEPYAPLTTFTYHFGFHANVAFYRWLSGDDMLHSVIWIGQILNALAVLVLYPLAVKASGGNRWAGVGAVLVAGLLSPMPMYYVNWGRYTQLAGQVILPVAMWLTWELGEKVKWDWKWVALLVISLAGLGIVHYRIVLLYGAFVAAWGTFFVWRKWKQWREMGRTALGLFLVAAVTLLLFLPWGVRTFQAQIPQLAQFFIEQGNQSQFHREEYNAIGPIWPFVPVGLLLLSLAGVAGYAYKRQITGWIIVLWVGMMLALANPATLYLPGTGIVNNFTVLIMLYIPVAILGASAMERVYAWLSKMRWPAAKWVWVGGLTLAAIWGESLRIKDLDMDHALVMPPDLEAITWIRENAPADARFLVNGFTAYGGGLVVGSDAGWWIPLLAQRANTIPPLTYGTEVPSIANYYHKILDDLSYAQEIGRNQTRLSDAQDISHIYVGYQRGQVNSINPPPLDVQVLLQRSDLHLVYEKNGVWIFAFVSPKTVKQ